MYIEGVIVCVDYGDFLAETLPLNRQQFDRLVVVTSPEDLETQRLCEYHHVECVPTSAFGPPGEFRKAAGINAGLDRLSQAGWVVHLDADIALPPHFRRAVEDAGLDPGMVYGCDRHTVTGHDAWRRQLRSPRLQLEDSVYVHANAYPVSTRFAPRRYGGYLPIGFMQLWSPRRSGVRAYPQEHTSAGRTDMLFAARWPRSRRGFLPEVVAYHLESEKADQGANWSGRTTARFEDRRGRLRRWWRRWRRKHHRHRRRPRPCPHPYGDDADLATSTGPWAADDRQRPE